MDKIEVKFLSERKEVEEELKKIGCSKRGMEIMSRKAITRLIKVRNLDPRAANILKQECLAVGGDAALAWDSISSNSRKTDALIIATLAQYPILLNKLKEQPFSLKKLSYEIEKALTNIEGYLPKVKIAGKEFDFRKRTYIMGILNVTPDSFSGDGIYKNPELAVEKAKRMVAEGADIIDVGGESSRPFSKRISAEEELERVIPVIEELRKHIDVPISIDTYKPEVAEEAIKAGASIVNDIFGLRKEGMVDVVSRHKAYVIIMHMKGTPENMQINPTYHDVVAEILEFLEKQVNFAIENGIPKERIMIDPGIGFGKTVEHNLEIIRHLKEFKILGCPILIGVSRKSFIGKVLNLDVSERLEGTLAAVAASVLNGANIVRVHDVKENFRVCKMLDAIRFGFAE